MKPLSLSISAAGIAVLAVTATAQSPNPFGIPSAVKPMPSRGSKPCPGRARRDGCFKGAPKSSPVTASSRQAIHWRRRLGSGYSDRAGTRLTQRLPRGAVIDVTSQNDTGIGGDLFALVWSARDKKLYALDSAGWAPAGWTPQFFNDKLGVKSVPGSGVNAVTVPGAISGYDALLKRFGSMTFSRKRSSEQQQSPNKAGVWRNAATPTCAMPPRVCWAIPVRPSDLSQRRSGAGFVRLHPEPVTGQSPTPSAEGGPRRVLPWRHCGGHRSQNRGQRRGNDSQRSG